jgi:hypothetical protein
MSTSDRPQTAYRTTAEAAKRPMSSPNAELAYKVLDHIDAKPASWNQGWWLIQGDCGTTACFAGLACVLSGDQPDFDHADDPPEHGWTYGSTVDTADQGATDVPRRAKRLLRLDSEDANRLFHSANTRADLGRLVEGIFGPRSTGTRPATEA